MRFTSETISDGVSERLFTVGDIPGVLWSPAGTAGTCPLVLLGHGGGQHKKAPGLVARARCYVTSWGFAVAAIDAPGHGDRPRTGQDERSVADMRERAAAGEPLGPQIARYNAALAARALPEWRAALDALQAPDYVGAGGPVGFWGVSMGSGIGVPFTAAEPRINAAVFGLAGGETLNEAAARITVPVEFLLQWDDEVVPRESGLALFGAFASREKTLHANPGRHADVPAFELDSSARFLARHLTAGGASAMAELAPASPSYVPAGVDGYLAGAPGAGRARQAGPCSRPGTAPGSFARLRPLWCELARLDSRRVTTSLSASIPFRSRRPAHRRPAR